MMLPIVFSQNFNTELFYFIIQYGLDPLQQDITQYNDLYTYIHINIHIFCTFYLVTKYNNQTNTYGEEKYKSVFAVCTKRTIIGDLRNHQTKKKLYEKGHKNEFGGKGY